MQYQQTTTQGFSTQQQASQVIYATQQYTTVTAVSNTQQTFHQQGSNSNTNNAFGLPNDQDSFGEVKDKRNLQAYKSFDWSDPSKYESLRNVLPTTSAPAQLPSQQQPSTQMTPAFNSVPAQMYQPNVGMFNPVVGAVPGFFPQSNMPPSPFTVTNNMGVMPFTPSTLPPPMQPTNYPQVFPQQPFVTPTLQPQLSQQLLQQQQLQQQQLQQQQLQQQQAQQQQLQQQQLRLQQQQLQQQQLHQQQVQQQQLQQQQLQQQQLQQQLQQQQIQQQQLQQQQLQQQQLQQQAQVATPRPPPSNALAPPSCVPSSVSNMVFAPLVGTQNISPTSSLSSISSIPTPISSTSSSSSSASPVPISPPSPALNPIRSNPIPQLQPTPSKASSLPPPPPASQGRSISPAIISLPVAATTLPVHNSANYSGSALYAEPRQIRTSLEIKPDTTDDAFFTQMTQEKKRKEEEDDGRKRKEAEELENKKALQQFAQQLQQQQQFQQFHHAPSPIPQPYISQPQPQPLQPMQQQQQQIFQQTQSLTQQYQFTQPPQTQSTPQVQVTPQIQITSQIPTPQITTPQIPSPHLQSTLAPSVERESNVGMLQKPPPARERARSDTASKNRQRDEQMRIVRELNQSPSAYPASPTSSTGSATGSGPNTPLGQPASPFNLNYPPTTPTPNYDPFPISPSSAEPAPRSSPYLANMPTFSSFPSSPALSPKPSPMLPQHKTSPNLSTPASRDASPSLLVNTLPAVNPANVSMFPNDPQVQRTPSNHIDLLSLEDPMPAQDTDEQRRIEIEKRVREELEEKHKQEMDQLRKAYESQKQTDLEAVGRLSLNPPTTSNRARSASHGASHPSAPGATAGGSQTARGQAAGGRTLPPAPTRLPHPQNPTVSIPSSFSLAPPSLTPPSPSLVVDPATKERRAQVKKDLASIIAKPPNSHPHPGAHANTESFGSTDPFPVDFLSTQSLPTQSLPAQSLPAQPAPLSHRHSISLDIDSLNSKLSQASVACPICGDSFQNERILAVHIDDAHGLGSVVGPNSSHGKKQVHFAGGPNTHRASGGPASIERTPTRNPLNSSIDALDLSFASPLGKSRSVDDMSNRKKDDDFGFEGFGMVHKPKQELPKSRSEANESREKDRGSALRNLFGRNRDRENATPTPTSSGGSSSGSSNQIVDLADFMGGSFTTPSKADSVRSDSSTSSSSGSGFFGKKNKEKGSSLGRMPTPRPSILDADLITGSPRPNSLDFNKTGDASTSNNMLMPRKKKKVDAPPLTPETAATKIQATYRMMVTHKEYRKIIFRTKVARELVTTEHTYVESIENAIKTFAVPLRQMAESGKPLISLEDVNTMFSRLQDILSINGALLEKLTLRIARWTVVQKIGDVWMQVLSNPINGLYFGKVYSDYTITYNNILETLDRCCREKSSFKRFIQNGEKVFWGSAGNTIQAFFILPVQRITRYILLFKEVIKYTSPDHPDYNNLVATLKEMECICIDVNESQRKEDTEKKRVQTLQQIHGKIEPRLKDLFIEGRYLLREGVISQFDVDDDQIKERYYFLFNDILLVTKKQKQKYLMRLHITLHNVRLKDIPDQNFLGHQIANAFEMHTPSKTVMFLVQTLEDKEVIFKELTEVITQAGGVIN